MPQFINLTTAEQNDLILRTASKLSISPLLIEKDFWVSWLLNTIFQSDFAKEITFKGGTSLSKCYGYISRFSEDILDRKHFSGESDEKELSNKGVRFCAPNDELEDAK